MRSAPVQRWDADMTPYMFYYMCIYCSLICSCSSLLVCVVVFYVFILCFVCLLCCLTVLSCLLTGWHTCSVRVPCSTRGWSAHLIQSRKKDQDQASEDFCSFLRVVFDPAVCFKCLVDISVTLKQLFHKTQFFQILTPRLFS